MLSNKKYLLMPGYVKSNNDKDRHYISTVQLRKLYNVPMNECLVLNNRNSTMIPPGLIKLRTKANGDYTIPEEK